MNNSELKKLINKQKTNYSLDQEFYIDQHIFDLDVKNIFSKQSSRRCSRQRQGCIRRVKMNEKVFHNLNAFHKVFEILALQSKLSVSWRIRFGSGAQNW